MKQFVKQILAFATVALIATVVFSLTFAHNMGHETKSATSVAQSEDYTINEFVEFDGKYVAKAFTSSELVGYIVVDDSDAVFVRLNDASPEFIQKVGWTYNPKGYDVQLANFKMNQNSLAQLNAGFRNDMVNAFPAVINGHNCIFALLKDGSYAIVRNGETVITCLFDYSVLNNF